MSRCATVRSDIERSVGAVADGSAGGPDRLDAVERECGCCVLVQVPVTAAHERAAIVYDRGDLVAAADEADPRAARQRAVRDAVVGVEAARGATAVVIPGCDRLPIAGQR